MKITSLLCVGASLLMPFAQALQLSDDPPSYFGSVNNGAYLNWVSEKNIETKYNNSVYMPSLNLNSGAAVHWTVDEEYIHIAVAARAAGWVGFGFSEVGGMLGSDMALFSINRPGVIVDAHVVENPVPKEDDCQQDWVFVAASSTAFPVAEQRANGDSVLEAVEAEEDEEFIMFEARRKLVTGDAQDIALIRDNLITTPETRIIAAWGDEPDASFHALNRARGSIRLFKVEVDVPDFDDLMARDADGKFFIGSNNYVIPGDDDTTYADFCFTRKNLIDQGVANTTDLISIIGFKPILNDGLSASFVHHYIVTGHFNASDDACSNNRAIDMVYVWAPGDGGFALPDFLGGNLFGEDGFQGFNIEIHYDNPRLESDVVDTFSGVEMYFSMTPRPVEMGVFQVGDPFVSLFGQPVGDGLSSHHFDCSGDCSGAFLSDGEPVTVIREYLHMHAAGTRTTNEHIRNGTVIREASTEVWDFDQNGNVPARQGPYEIQPGDGFRMSCYYRDDQNTVFGLSSREEMCMAFLFYYPRKTFELEVPQGSFSLPWMCAHGNDWLGDACFANYTAGEPLESEVDLHRIFGKKNSECYLETDGTPLVSVETGDDIPLDSEGPQLVTQAPVPEEDEGNESGIPEEEDDAEGSLVPGDSPVSGASVLSLSGVAAALIALAHAGSSF